LPIFKLKSFNHANPAHCELTCQVVVVA
jgi:hypothetical protein